MDYSITQTAVPRRGKRGKDKAADSATSNTDGDGVTESMEEQIDKPPTAESGAPPVKPVDKKDTDTVAADDAEMEEDDVCAFSDPEGSTDNGVSRPGPLGQ